MRIGINPTENEDKDNPDENENNTPGDNKGMDNPDELKDKDNHDENKNNTNPQTKKDKKVFLYIRDIPHVSHEFFDTCCEIFQPVRVQVIKFVLAMSSIFLVVQFAASVLQSVQKEVELPEVLNKLSGSTFFGWHYSISEYHNDFQRARNMQGRRKNIEN